MNTKGNNKELTLGGLVLAILIFIGLCLAVIWAVSGSGSNEVNNTVLNATWYLIGLAVLFLIVIGLIVILAILVKNTR